MRVGIAHHLGWAVAVTASPDHEVVDRRRIELIEPGMPTAPIVDLYDGKDVERQAVNILGAQAHEVLHGPRATLGPPWAKDHRMALAATIMAGGI